jgi:hypothetical protein
VNEIFAYRSQTRFNQQGSIGKKYYSMLLEFVSNPNLFEMVPAPRFPATNRSYSSIRPHLNKLLPTLIADGSNQNNADVESSIKWRISNKSSKNIAVIEKCDSNEMDKTHQVPAQSNRDNFECPKPSVFSVQDSETGLELATWNSLEWSNTCNFVHIEVEKDVSIDFMHDQTDNFTQVVPDKLKNCEIKGLMKYLYTDERIKTNLANLKETMKDSKFWYFPTKDQVWTVHHELKKILGFKYIRLWAQLFDQDESNSSKLGYQAINSETAEVGFSFPMESVADKKYSVEVIFKFFFNFLQWYLSLIRRRCHLNKATIHFYEWRHLKKNLNSPRVFGIAVFWVFHKMFTNFSVLTK